MDSLTIKFFKSQTLRLGDQAEDHDKGDQV